MAKLIVGGEHFDVDFKNRVLHIGAMAKEIRKGTMIDSGNLWVEYDGKNNLMVSCNGEGVVFDAVTEVMWVKIGDLTYGVNFNTLILHSSNGNLLKSIAEGQIVKTSNITVDYAAGFLTIVNDGVTKIFENPYHGDTGEELDEEEEVWQEEEGDEWPVQSDPEVWNRVNVDASAPRGLDLNNLPSDYAWHNGYVGGFINDHVVGQVWVMVKIPTTIQQWSGGPYLIKRIS